MTTSLAWFPFDGVEWEKLIGQCSVEEEGALIRVMRKSWANPVPCTIEDTSAALDHMLGSRWKKLASVVRRHFVPSAEFPGRLVSPWLLTKHTEQLARYQKKASGGGLGGRMKAANWKLASQQSDLFRPKSAASSATLSARSTASEVPLQSKEGSSPFGEEEPTVGACAAGATPPVDQSEPPPWDGPDTRALQRWAAEDPERLASVETRVDAQLQALALGPTADTHSAKHWLRIPLLRELWRSHRGANA